MVDFETLPLMSDDLHERSLPKDLFSEEDAQAINMLEIVGLKPREVAILFAVADSYVGPEDMHIHADLVSMFILGFLLAMYAESEPILAPESVH